MLSQSRRLSLLEPPKEHFDLIIDTDTYNEIDDQFAVSYALLSPDRVTVQALYAAPFLNERSSSPEDGMNKSYDELLHLLQLSNKSVPVFHGSARYLPDEKTPVVSDAALDLCERAMRYSADKPLYVACISAITNLASALLLKPEIAERMVIVWLGGHSLEWPDNYEFNCRQDVAAARVIFSSGVPLVILPCLGVVSAFTTTEPELNYWLKGKNRLCDYLVSHTVEAANEYAKGKVWSRVIWDVTAVGWLFNREGRFMRDKLIPTPIPQYDHHYSPHPTAPLCRYIYHIERDALFGDLFARLAAEESR